MTMSDHALPSDPIAQLLDICRDIQTALQVPAMGTPWPADVARGSLCLLHSRLDALHRVIGPTLREALLESMAGSDAVCIRGLADAVAHAYTQAQQAWHRLAASLPPEPAGALPCPNGGAVVSLPADACASLRTWVEQSLAWLAVAQDDLLPMAQRLLDDAALSALSRSMEDMPP